MHRLVGSLTTLPPAGHPPGGGPHRRARGGASGASTCIGYYVYNNRGGIDRLVERGPRSPNATLSYTGNYIYRQIAMVAASHRPGAGSRPGAGRLSFLHIDHESRPSHSVKLIAMVAS